MPSGLGLGLEVWNPDLDMSRIELDLFENLMCRKLGGSNPFKWIGSSESKSDAGPTVCL